MKTNGFVLFGTLAAVALLLGGCSARPTKPAASNQAGTVFSASPATTQQAARNALTTLGFQIKKAQPSYVEGYRPRKVGALVGSGGETAAVWLEPVGTDQTRVLVDTAKSVVGIAGQKDWDAAILAEMRNGLARAQ
jgi:hypothetical protein